MPKPFISARIPEAVNSAIDKRSEQTGESRTDILLNALSNYLEGDIKAPISVDERLSALEEEFAQFKTELASPIQTTLLDNNTDNNSDFGSTIHSHSTSTASKDSSDNNNDNKFENRKEGEWTNKQLEAVGISRSTVEGRMRKNQLPYTKNGVTVHRRLRKEKRGRYTISIWEVSKEDWKED